MGLISKSTLESSKDLRRGRQLPLVVLLPENLSLDLSSANSIEFKETSLQGDKKSKEARTTLCIRTAIRTYKSQNLDGGRLGFHSPLVFLNVDRISNDLLLVAFAGSTT
jgi:hypothetical protein